MKRQELLTILALHYILFAVILFTMWLVMSTHNLELELEYMKSYENAVSSENLQDIMCNGEPV
jgi:hypothetical protein